MKRAAVFAAASCALLFALPAKADAPGDPRISYVIDGVNPPTTGITAALEPPALTGAPPLTKIDNTTSFDLIVLDPAGTPMLRTGPHGSYGNIRSRYLAAALNPGRSGVSASVPPGSGPAWSVVGVARHLRFYDPRTVYRGASPKNQSATQTLVQFHIACQIRAAHCSIDGRVVFKPLRGTIEAAVLSTTFTDSAISIDVAPGPIPAIQLRNGSQSTIEVTGRDGRPFARVGPKGVDVNVNSATWHDTKSLPPPATTAVSWKHYQAAPILIWLERRAAFSGDPPETIQRSRVKKELSRWRVSGTIDGASFEIAGADYWVPAAATATRSSTPGPGAPAWVWPVATGVAVIALAIGLRALLKRRSA